MITEEKLLKLKKLADAMYYAAQYLTTDASRLHKAMDEYHKFIIHECKEEPVSEDLEEAAEMFIDSLIPTEVETVTPFAAEYVIGLLNKAIEFGANWQKEQIIKRLCNNAYIGQMVEKFEDKYKPEKVLDTEYYKRGIFDTIKAIKED